MRWDIQSAAQLFHKQAFLQPLLTALFGTMGKGRNKANVRSERCTVLQIFALSFAAASAFLNTHV